MFYFKDRNDGFYVVENLDIAVPEGSVQISKEEYLAANPEQQSTVEFPSL